MNMPMLQIFLLFFCLCFTTMSQFTDGFAPSSAPYGGFGGCSSHGTAQTAIVLLHGNSNSASDWSNPSSQSPGSNPLTHFSSAGYECVFALTWLSSLEQSLVSGNYHRESKAKMVGDFVRDVSAYMTVGKVVIIGHSMGVTVGLHALDYTNRWNLASTFIAISPALLGLSINCTQVGYANPLAPTCGSQNLLDSNIFGFFPGDNSYGSLARNPRMSSSGFVTYPANHLSTKFYSINSGPADEIVCPDHNPSTCHGLSFNTPATASNVPAQIMVGQGQPYINAAQDDDSEGVGHFRAKSDTGAIQVRMIQGCTGNGCCNGYGGTICTGQ